MPPAAREHPSSPPGWLAILSLMTAVWLSSLDQSIANTALPAIGAALQHSPAESVWILHAYQLAVVATLLPFAALGDVWGARRVFMVGVALFNLAAIGSALAPSLEWLALSRAIQGIGASGLMSVNLALVRQIFPSQRLGQGVGLNAFIVGSGYSLGPVVASLLLSVAPWPWLFGCMVPMGILGWLLGWRFLPHAPPASLASQQQPYDLTLALLSAVCFASLIVCLSAVAQQKGVEVLGTAFIVMLVSGYALLRRQRGHTAPMLPVDLLRRPLFSLSVFTAICSFTTQGLAYVALPFFFLHDLQLSAVTCGTLMTVWAGVVALAAPLAGRLSDRYPPAIMGGMGLCMLSLGMVWLSQITPGTSTTLIRVGMALCGIGFGLFQSPNLRAIMSSSPPERSSGASGMVALARLIGQASGAALVALCFNLFAPVGAGQAILLGAFTAGLGGILSVSRLWAR
jgi:DHA2 family multidrug resistance protein-like MFS transporter